MQDLKNKIQNKQVKIGVIGLGYVGLPLACEFAKAGVEVLGFDVNSEKVDLVNKGQSYIQDVKSEEVEKLTTSGRLKATTNFSLLSSVDVISICVPTPLRKTKDPDMSYIAASIESVKTNLRKGHVIILESTTYPGTTGRSDFTKIRRNGFESWNRFLFGIFSGTCRPRQ